MAERKNEVVRGISGLSLLDPDEELLGRELNDDSTSSEDLSDGSGSASGRAVYAI